MQNASPHDRFVVMAEASRAFATAGTDIVHLLQRVAHATAELIGDGCLVTLLDRERDQFRNTASAHRDPELDTLYRTYLAQLGVSRLGSTTVAARVMRTGEPALVTDIDPAVVTAGTDENLRPLIAKLAVHSYAVVPIRARGEILGTLSLLRSGPGRGYTVEDRELLADLADRAGLAIDSALLYGELEQRVRQRTAELEVVNRELEAFSYSVAHDLRAPLRAIDGFSMALLDDWGDRFDDTARSHLGRVRDAAQRMGTLIDALLKLAGLARGELRRERIDLSAAARAITGKLHEAEPARVVELVIAPDLVADGDPRLVEIVLSNLLGNAWKFTAKREHARIEFGATPREAGMPPTYFVRDNGAGFDPARIERLFQPFQRLHRTEEFEGTGIGLATVSRIIIRHGGAIRAEGAIDTGATFYFTLAPAPV